MNYTAQISRIQPSTTSHIAATEKTAAQTSSKPLESATQTAPAVDHADLSAASMAVAAALKTSDVRLDKVAHLQQAIASGNYKVSSEAVAGKLIESLLQR